MDTFATSHLQYASDTDYTPVLTGFSALCVVLGTLAISGRCTARYTSGTSIGLDDVFAGIGYVSLIANLIANFVVSATGAVGIVPMAPEKTTMLNNALLSVYFTYPMTLLGGKLSLLFLYKRIFGMRQLWFQILWWTTFLTIFPVLLTLCFVFGGMLVASGSPEPSSPIAAYGIFTVGFVCAVTNLIILILPIGMVLDLRIDRSKQFGLIFIFSLGGIGSVVAFLRSARSLQAIKGNWDPRYKIFEDSMLCVAETTTLLLCACLPLIRPIFIKIIDATIGSIKSMSLRGSSMGSSQKSNGISMRTNGTKDDEVELKNGVIVCRTDVMVDDFSLNETSPPQSLRAFDRI